MTMLRSFFAWAVAPEGEPGDHRMVAWLVMLVLVALAAAVVLLILHLAGLRLGGGATCPYKSFCY